MTNELRVTAVVPNYNHARFLFKRLQTVYNQTYPWLQVIILDDCSTDDSKSIIESYRNHPRTRAIVYNEVNSGSPFLQWKKGIALADTEWIWIAESDDYCTSQLLEWLQPAINAPDCVLAYVEVDEVDEKGNLLLERRTGMNGMIDGRSFAQKHLILGTALVNAGMVLLRRSAVLKAGDTFTGFRLCGDYWLHYQVALQGKVFAAGTREAFFRRHPQEVSHSLLHSPVFIGEMFSVYEHQLAIGLVKKNLAKYFIEHQLHALICRRADLQASDFISEQDFLLGWAARLKIRINIAKVEFRAFKSKFFHWWKRTYTLR